MENKQAIETLAQGFISNQIRRNDNFGVWNGYFWGYNSDTGVARFDLRPTWKSDSHFPGIYTTRTPATTDDVRQAMLNELGV